VYTRHTYGELTLNDARDLRQRGIQTAKAGQKDEARDLLQRSIRLDPSNEAAWLWLASVARDNQERIFCLQKLLEINPQNDTARKALDAANQATPPPMPVKRLPNAPVTKAPAVPDVMSQAPGVPVPMPDRIAEAQRQADPVVRDYLAPQPPANVKWVHKTHRRAGERDILVYRAYVATGITIVIVLLIAAGVFVVQTNEGIKNIVLGPSATPTPSPTITPTNTPGLTPTPSATPRLSPTPSATPPPNLLAASPPALPKATEIYPQILERPVFDSALLLSQGQMAEAIPTLDNERKANTSTRLSASPYYYEAVALAQQGKFSDALSTLDEGTGRLNTLSDNGKVKALLEAGYAEVYWMQAQQARANGDPAGAQTALGQVGDHGQAAITGDKRLTQPYILIAQADALSGKYNDAAQILSQGLSVPELNSNTELLMQLARVYYQGRDFNSALYQIFLTLYIDPSIEAAYQLKIQIGMDRNRPGDAVLAAQDYLYYYPGSTTAFRLLGEARLAEHKDDLALQAFSQGLNGPSTDADVQKMLEERAQIYHRQQRDDLALADYNRLFKIAGDAQVQSLRMRAAFDNGKYDQALSDAVALDGDEAASPGIVNLIRGASLIEQAKAGDTSNDQQAITFLNQAIASPDVASAKLLGEANEYLARAKFAVHDYKAAQDAINASLSIAETGSGHYWRGRILQAQGDRASAVSDYEWVMAWSEVFPYPFRADAQDRLTTLTTG
jgi:Tfp pilus assembly protein PilF